MGQSWSWLLLQATRCQILQICWETQEVHLRASLRESQGDSSVIHALPPVIKSRSGWNQTPCFHVACFQVPSGFTDWRQQTLRLQPFEQKVKPRSDRHWQPVQHTHEGKFSLDSLWSSDDPYAGHEVSCSRIVGNSLGALRLEMQQERKGSALG